MRDFFSRLAEVFQGKPRKGVSPPSRTSTEYGFLVFQHTGEVIRAERILREAGFAVEVKGGCPDVPYLAALLTGQCIGEAEEPRVKGQTLCSYSLQRAFEEARRLWRG